MQHGDGHPLDANVRCSIGVNRLPVDGTYDAEIVITNNNGSVEGHVQRWLRPGTEVAVEEVQECVGAT